MLSELMGSTNPRTLLALRELVASYARWNAVSPPDAARAGEAKRWRNVLAGAVAGE